MCGHLFWEDFIGSCSVTILFTISSWKIKESVDWGIAERGEKTNQMYSGGDYWWKTKDALGKASLLFSFKFLQQHLSFRCCVSIRTELPGATTLVSVLPKLSLVQGWGGSSGQVCICQTGLIPHNPVYSFYSSSQWWFVSILLNEHLVTREDSKTSQFKNKWGSK